MRSLKVVVAAVSVSVIVSATADAAVGTDGTMGAKTDLQGPNYTVDSTLGQTVGNKNLFHSFSTFSVNKGESVTFNGPASISNIISRVTGGEVSSIDGKIASTIQGANLYLVNPSGIMFGPNATLDVSGSFYATTADYLKLGSEGRFDGTTDPSKTNLTADPPSAFGFLAGPKGTIQVTDSSLSVKTGTLTLVGGDLSITNKNKGSGSILSSPIGINLISVGSAGEATVSDAGIDTSSFSKMGTTTVSRSTSNNPDPDISTSGGRIFISAGSFLGDRAYIASNTSGNINGKDITIQCRDKVLISNFGRISTGSSGTGNAGNITIAAPTVTVDKSSITLGGDRGEGSGSNSGNLSISASDVTLQNTATISTNSAEGKGGDINITATGSITVDRSAITSKAYGSKDAGNITLQAPKVTVQKGGSIELLGNGSGNAGNLSVSASDVAITTIGFISTFSPVGKGGDINITASGSITVAGSGGQASRIVSNSSGAKDAGNITLIAPTVTLKDRGEIHLSSFGSGNAGDLHIISDNVTLLGRSAIFDETNSTGSGGTVSINTGTLAMANSKITLEAAGTGNGNGGSIVIDAKESVSLSGGSSLTTHTTGSQNAGNITIAAPTMTMENGALIDLSSNGSGNAGNLTVAASDVAIATGGLISTRSEGSGKGGDITFDIGEGGSVTVSESRILSGTLGPNDAGNINITARTGTVTVDGGAISLGKYIDAQGNIKLDTGTGNAGTLTISASDVVMKNGGILSTDSNLGKGGDIHMTAIGSVRVSESSRITSTNDSKDAGNINIAAPTVLVDGGSISADTFGAGKGGNITIGREFPSKTDSLSIRSGSISSSTSGAGNAGSITVKATDVIMTSSGKIAASTTNTGKAGNIQINAAEYVTLSSGSTMDVSTAGKGDAGTLRIETASLSLSDKAKISSESAGEGNAGSITINAPSVTINDATVTSGTSGAGNAGGITVGAGVLTLNNGGRIETSSEQQSQGQGGHIDIQATEAVSISGATTTIATNTAGTGAAGSIFVSAPSLSITNGGSISAISSGTGNAGAITLGIGELLMDGGTITTGATKATGGNISIETAFVDLMNSSISTSVQGDVGNGGNISLSATTLVLENSSITADAHGGNGGSVAITADAYIKDPQSSVTASSDLGLPGTVDINAPLVDLSGTLVSLPEETLKDDLSPRTCGAAGGSASSFIVGTSCLQYRPGTDLLTF